MGGKTKRPPIGSLGMRDCWWNKTFRVYNQWKAKWIRRCWQNLCLEVFDGQRPWFWGVLLQSTEREMGVLVDRTPKCHCELLVGEGIKDSWGCAKNSYRHRSLKQKQGKDIFKTVVRECCLLREKVLVTEKIRLFQDPRARPYICAYYMIKRKTALLHGSSTNVGIVAIKMCD